MNPRPRRPPRPPDTRVDLLPDEVADLLAGLSRACNDASLTHAQTRLRHLARQRRLDRGEAADQPAGGDPLRPVTAGYLRDATWFATVAVQILSRIADAQPATVADPQAVTPFDALSLPQLHLPLVRIPTPAAATGERPAVLHAVNAELADSHARLTAALAPRPAGRVPAPACDEPRHAAATDQADGLLARTLHGYAATCAWAIAVLAQRDPR
jgi:hypothetical protein